MSRREAEPEQPSNDIRTSAHFGVPIEEMPPTSENDDRSTDSGDSSSGVESTDLLSRLSGNPNSRGGSSALGIGMRFGNRNEYEIIGEIGRGGFGEVWKVRHESMERPRAVKVIAREHAHKHPSLLARMKIEASSMEQIESRHAAKIFDFLTIHGVPAIVMEFVDGRTLRAEMRQHADPSDRDRFQPFAPRFVARILHQLCEVLQEAHSVGIIHRDLKPENLMLLANRAEGREFLKVLDFGIAKIVRDGSDESTAQATLTQGNEQPPCTPAYASREQIQGNELDGRSDLYSVGVILYEMLTGRRPFEQKDFPTNFQMMQAQVSEIPPTFAEANPQVKISPAIEAVVRRCLEKDREKRPRTALELRQAFFEAIEPEVGFHDIFPDLATPTPSEFVKTKELQKLRAKPNTARHLGLAGVAAMVLLGLCLGVYNSNRPIIPGPIKPDDKSPDDKSKLIRKQGFEPVGTETTRDGWPAEISKSSSDGVRRTYVALDAGRYLPKDYSPSGGTVIAKDGWPEAIERKGAHDGDPPVVFRRICAGQFSMGGGNQPEASSHKVQISSGYYLQETEVTYAEIIDVLDPAGARELVGKDGEMELNEKSESSYPKAMKYPVISITWDKAQQYAKKVGGDLPTEAQWEFAARNGGNKNWEYVWDGPFQENFSALDAVDKVAAASVAEYKDDCSIQKIYDLAGNVREWCRDSFEDYRKDTLSSEVSRDPCTDRPENNRVVRGGSWLQISDYGKVYYRHQADPRKGFKDIGFRVVIEPVEFEQK